jgi:hypothetical protein
MVIKTEARTGDEQADTKLLTISNNDDFNSKIYNNTFIHYYKEFLKRIGDDQDDTQHLPV